MSGKPVAVITGGAGFIGSVIAARIEADDSHDIVICDWFGHEAKWRNVAKRCIADWVPPESLFDFLTAKGGAVDAIIHMGAISSTTETDVDLIMSTNFVLSKKLWAWSAQHGKRFIYASSAATYGSGAEGFDDESSLTGLARLQPLNAYGWSKHLFDQFVLNEVQSSRSMPRQWVGLKFFNVYGPNEYHKGSMKSVVAQIYPKAVAGEAVHLFKSHHPDYQHGGQMRDFVYVKDCADVVAWLLSRPDTNGLFNLGTGTARTFGDLARAVFAALNRAPNIKFVDTPKELRKQYQYFTEASMHRLRSAGYTAAFHSLEDGIRDYVQSHLNLDDPYL